MNNLSMLCGHSLEGIFMDVSVIIICVRLIVEGGRDRFYSVSVRRTKMCLRTCVRYWVKQHEWDLNLHAIVAINLEN